MSAIYELFEEYTRMRTNGMDSKEVLRTLRPYVEQLNTSDKEELAQHVRAWEAGEADVRSKPAPPPKESAPPKKSNVIKPLGPRSTSSVRDVVSRETSSEAWVTCSNCGKKNRTHEVFCYACGHMLEPAPGEHDTRIFQDADPSLHSASFFGGDSVLMLEMRDLHQYFELRPQISDHEIIIGRSAANSAMIPDVDLTDFQGAETGVSRLHTAIKYDKADEALQVYDLGSSNGTFINGQRLLPKEIRVLRHGDEIRLGRFVLRAYFRHPGDEIR